MRISSSHVPDVPLLGGVLGLLIFGLLLVYDSSAPTSGSSPYHYLILQSVWVLVGLVVFFVLSRLDYRFWKKVSFPLFGLAVMLLVLVLLPTPLSGEIRGSSRWLTFPVNLPLVGESLSFQPSELAKLALILYLAALFSTRKAARVLPFLLATGLISGLIFLEPDFGTTIATFLLGAAVFFFAGGAFHLLLPLGLAVIGGILALAWSDPVRARRITAFLNPGADPLNAGYQITQILIALGSGGVLGLGIGQSRQKYDFIPDVQTDAIFAVIGEEFGFVGAAIVVSLFAFLVYRGFKIARAAPDEFGRIAAAGITSWIGLQALMNLGAVTGLLPLKGISLPLVSYGGSGLVVSLAALGILLNISKHTVVRSSLRRRR